MRRPAVLLSSLIVLLLIASLVGCNPENAPGSAVILPATPTTTVQESRQAATATGPPHQVSPTPPTPVATLPTVSATETSFPPTATPVCDLAAAGNPLDVTIPDNSLVKPGQAFTKTWRLVNAGTCTWTAEYAMIYFSGAQLGAPSTVYLPRTVAPGQTVELSLDMVAPQSADTYQSNWMLESPSGKQFGLGPNGNSPFWVRIEVEQPQTPVATAVPTPAPTAPVVVGGLANLHLNQSIDVDTNQIGQGEADDFVFKIVGDSSHQLIPENGAQASVYGSQVPEMEDCKNASLSSAALILDGLDTGLYVCYKTNRGLPGNFRLVYLNTNDEALSLEITTWAIP